MAVYTPITKEKLSSFLKNYNIGSLENFKGVLEGVENTDKFDISLINDVQNIGITASASAPEILVQNFIQFLKEKFTTKVYETEYIKEDTNFKIPQQLKVTG